MKRFAPLALLVLAFAVTPVAFADDTTPAPAAPAATTTSAAGHPIARMRLEILRLRLQLVHLRYRVACHQQDSDRCTQFTKQVTDRLTTLDGKVQARIDELKQCTSASTEDKCKNADKKIAVLTKIDTKLKNVIEHLGDPSSASDSSSDSAVDQAANALGQLAGSTQP
jgi:hypothetical protein